MGEPDLLFTLFTSDFRLLPSEISSDKDIN